MTNWLPGERRVVSPYNGLKVYGGSSVEDEELKQLVMAQSEIETLGVLKLADRTRSIWDKGALPLMHKTTFKSAGEDASGTDVERRGTFSAQQLRNGKGEATIPREEV